MFNPKIFKNNKVWYLIIATISFSYPLLLLNKIIFAFILMCVFLIIPFFISKLLAQDFREKFEVKIYVSWIKMMFYLFGILLMAQLIIKFFDPNNPWVVIAFCWLMFGMLLVWLVENLLILTKHLHKFIRTEQKSKKSIYFCLLIIIIAFIAPDLTFAYGYKFFFSTLYSIEFQNYLESFYLSFVVTYTLPVSNEKLSSHIDLINKEFVLYTYQMVQVYFKKILDIVLIALIVGYLQDLIKGNLKGTVK
ncbi:hypothetical protein [Lysinibacillus fusiformis]|uniref:hypothetical protein n=1 Tax=Lysinibacillus fusiformis TaxID=28031 RepID=UPI001247C58E|nr:hypothetical protein [Lysinibacillus fusiformis]KAB0443274.1 hypothetical protein CH314_06450 [Lysinibacillus fusiformis]